MKYLIFFAWIACLTLEVAACAKEGPTNPTSGKIEGPAVQGLSHDQLEATLKECMQFGKMDDPRVRYTPRYCASVMSAHLSEGYTKSAKPSADPSINRLH